MHGLINRAVQCFLRDTFGQELWHAVASDAGFGTDGFDTMASYPQSVTDGLIDVAARALSRPREMLLEDLGTYLVSHRTVEPIRRLLRFGGASFMDFLLSVEDLQGRSRLAVPDIDVPLLTLNEEAPDIYLLSCRSPVAGAGHVLMGLLRAMADDYGALVLLDHQGQHDGAEWLRVNVLETSFAAGRSFDLGRTAMSGAA
ncbi:MAG: heme NO-binding domain-containing protein [Paracoccaceae bacterium]